MGRVTDVRLTDTGVDAVLSLQSDIKIPADLDAQVHSQTAVGELFVELLPRSGDGAPLKNGDVIPAGRTSVPPRHQRTAAGCQHRYRGDPARQPQNGDRRVLYGVRWLGPPSSHG